MNCYLVLLIAVFLLLALCFVKSRHHLPGVHARGAMPNA